MSGNVECGCWFKWTQDWWKAKDDSHQLHITYEWMMNHRKDVVLKLADFLGEKLSDDLVDLIEKRTAFKFMQNHPMSNYSTWDCMYMYISEKSFPFDIF